MDILFLKMMNFLVNIFLDHNDRLNFISNFSGSYGLALILKKKIIYLLTEGILYKQIIKVENLLKLLQFQIKCQVIFLKKKNYQLVLILIYLQKKL